MIVTIFMYVMPSYYFKQSDDTMFLIYGAIPLNNDYSESTSAE